MRAAVPRADPVLGFYGPDSMMWRINREALIIGSGPAALLLQIAHPLIAEGVAHHSTFEDDPFRRLHGTLRTTMDLVFGDGPASERAVRRLNGIHARVRGPVEDEVGRRVAAEYRAMDPELLLWVQATLIVTSVRAYETWVDRLSDGQKERFWQEARSVGVRLGIPLAGSPADWPALMEYWDAMLAPHGPIHPSPTALRLARQIIRPPFPLVPTALVDLASLPGLLFLPDRVRDEFGIPWSANRERLARLLGTAMRGWVRIVPAGWRAMPQARAAERRASSEGASQTRLRRPRTTSSSRS